LQEQSFSGIEGTKGAKFFVELQEQSFSRTAGAKF
jgi:hypothetical protein